MIFAATQSASRGVAEGYRQVVPGCLSPLFSQKEQRETAKNSGPFRCYCGRRNPSQPRISAANEICLAVNLPPEQRKQREEAERAVNRQRLLSTVNAPQRRHAMLASLFLLVRARTCSAPTKTSEVAAAGVDGRVMCGWPPARKDFSAARQQRSLAVMCPACDRGRWPQALMGSVDRDLIKPARSQCPMTRQRSVSIRRSTDDAITRFHPRKSRWFKVQFLCSISAPFLCPDPRSDGVARSRGQDWPQATAAGGAQRS